MPVKGRKPRDEAAERNRVRPVHDWTEVTDLPFDGLVPVKLPSRRVLSSPEGPHEVAVHPMTRNRRLLRRRPRRRKLADPVARHDWPVPARLSPDPGLRVQQAGP